MKAYRISDSVFMILIFYRKGHIHAPSLSHFLILLRQKQQLVAQSLQPPSVSLIVKEIRNVTWVPKRNLNARGYFCTAVRKLYIGIRQPTLIYIPNVDNESGRALSMESADNPWKTRRINADVVGLARISLPSTVSIPPQDRVGAVDNPRLAI